MGIEHTYRVWTREQRSNGYGQRRWALGAKENPKGEDHPSCKLTDEQCLEIYHRANEPGANQNALAMEFNVSPGYISRLKNLTVRKYLRNYV